MTRWQVRAVLPELIADLGLGTMSGRQ